MLVERKTTINFGKVDFNGRGRKVNRVEIEIRWDGRRLSICGGIWNSRGTDYVACGQNVEECASYFPRNAKMVTLLDLWRKWHLNDMRAGSPAQQAHLKAHPVPTWPDHYQAALDSLTAAGLQPDPNYLHNGKPYRYGSAWLSDTIPADDIARILSFFPVELFPDMHAA